MKKETWIPLFFAVAACSWMPHWACHYYRIETGSLFIVGSWNFTVADSVKSMLVYSLLIALNLFSVSYRRIRVLSALLSGILHLTLGIVHIVRLMDPFPFVVFGFEWSRASSIREIFMVLPFGLICIAVGIYVRKNRALAAS